MLLSAMSLYLLSFVILLIMQVFFFIKKVSIYRNLLYTALLIYINLVLGITLFPIPINIPVRYDAQYFFIPFSDILGEFRAGIDSVIKNLLGNVIMFVPLGVLLPLLLRKRNLIRVLLISTSATVFIEFMQFLIGVFIGYRYRGVNIDDVILNLTGAILGYLVYKVIPSSIKSPYLLREA